MAFIHIYDGEGLRGIDAPVARPLRWAAWRPDGAWALLAGNRGEAWRFDGERFERLQTGSTHNLRGAAWSPDGKRALLCGNRGALLLFEGGKCRELPAATSENLRRIAWAPDGGNALIIGNAGTVLRYEASTGAVVAVPGDRAHTMRSIAFRPDGAYALIGAYASRYAGYPRPHMLYRCDGRYTQALFATDDEDDAIAIAWRPEGRTPEAMILCMAYTASGGKSAAKLITYDGAGFTTRKIDPPAALIGAAWRPDGAYALLCGERGTLVRYDGERIDTIASDTTDNLIGPFWHPSGATALFLKGPQEKVYTA